MNPEELLRSSIAMLSTCHVVGSEAEVFVAALKNLKILVSEIERKKQEVSHDPEESERS